MSYKSLKNKKYLDAIINRVKDTKISLPEMIQKLRIKLSTFYQLIDENKLEELRTAQNTDVKNIIFKNIMTNINDLEDFLIDFLKNLELELSRLQL
ncbi:MAG: hypothetical protein ACTSWR_10200 [Candidatus Helarchaeota archaeon]